MKKCPGWNKPGDNVDGTWKQDLLRFLGKEFQMNILVETGACEGSTIIALQSDFEQIYSIELSEYYYKIAHSRTHLMPNVHLYHGNSAHLMGKILHQIRHPRILFWLDAHSSGGLTADAGDPLPTEIKEIQNHAPNAIVVIDDYQDTTLGNVTEAGISLEGWERHYVSGEIIMFRQGQYVLPELES